MSMHSQDSKVNDETWILVEPRVEPVMQELGLENYVVTETLTGRNLEGA